MLQEHCGFNVKEIGQNPGNLGKKLFRDGKIFSIAESIPNEDNLRDEFIKLAKCHQTIDRITKQTRLTVGDVTDLEVAQEKEQKLLSEGHFGKVQMNNQMHSIQVHPKEWIKEEWGVHNTGLYSLEALECGNEKFRHIRRRFTFRGDIDKSLHRLSELQWLISSPWLRKQTDIKKRVFHCSKYIIYNI